MKEKALPEIENHMFEENDKIRLAATECMCNLVSCKEVRMAERWLHDIDYTQSVYENCS